jgi:hypothetical protein
MEKAVTRLNTANGSASASNGAELGGEFPISDLNTNENGILQITMDGIILTFRNQKVRETKTKKRIKHSASIDLFKKIFIHFVICD